MQEQAVEVKSRRSLRPRPANPIQTASTSIQKATTQKRPREAEVEQATGHRRTKRFRKLDQQLLPVQQSKGRKRRLETLDLIPKSSTEAPRKRARQSPGRVVVETSVDKEEAASEVGEEERDPIRYWTKTHKWPRGDPEQSDNNMSHLLARQKSSNSLRRKQSAQASVDPASVAPSSIAPSSTTPSDQKPREAKSAPYQDPRYETLLATKGSFMGKPTLGITQKSKENYLNLLDARQTVPKDSLFCDELFEEACEMIRNENEARVVRDVSQLIVPSAEVLAARGAKSLKILAESVNEGWNNSIPLTPAHSLTTLWDLSVRRLPKISSTSLLPSLVTSSPATSR